jgi:hypothetical protein
MLFLKQKWWKEAQHRILRDVKQNTFRQSLFHKWTSRNIEHQPLDEAATAGFPCGCMFFYQPLKLLTQVVSHLRDILQKIVTNSAGLRSQIGWRVISGWATMRSDGWDR